MAKQRWKTSISEFHPKNIFLYISSLKENFGLPFFLMMTSTYIGVKGALHFFVTFVELPYYRAIGQEGTVYQVNSAASSAPWTAKGIIGVISDLYPLFGFYKTYYLYIYSIIGVIGLILMASLPYSITSEFTFIPALCFFLIFTQTAGYDLLLEGKYSEQMKKYPQTKGSIATYSWFGTVSGQLIPAVTVGVMSDYFDIRYQFIVYMPFSIQPLYFLYKGGMIEDEAPPEKKGKIDIEKWKQQWKPMFLTLLMSAGGIGLAVVALAAGRLVQLIYSVVISAIMVVLSLMLLHPIIAKVNAFKFFGQTFYINIMGAMDYWYTAEDDCVPGGPSFSWTFYKTYVELLGAFAQILGLIIFQVVFMKWKFRFIYWTSTFIRMAASIFDIIIVNRWNKDIGIPDQAMYIFGNAIIYKATYMIDFIPGVILNAKLCPRYVESTMYSLLASSSNYGQAISKIIGAYLIDALGITTTIERGCKFENLSLLIIISHLMAPIISILMTFILIPDMYVTENFVDSKESYEYYQSKMKIMPNEQENPKLETV